MRILILVEAEKLTSPNSQGMGQDQANSLQQGGGEERAALKAAKFCGRSSRAPAPMHRRPRAP
jgi:hypothetical protein